MTTILAKQSRAAIMALAAAGAALLLSGCGSTSGNALVAPGKYRLYDCIQLGQVAASYVAREKDLRGAMLRAEAGSGGAVVSALAYRNEYTQVQGNLSDLRREVTEKQCDPPPPGLFTAPGATPRR